MKLEHHFLLSMPSLGGDYFAQALLYIYEHNQQGAMGLIVNRPSSMSLAELNSQLGLSLNRNLLDTTVFEGGPVAPEQGFVLHSGNEAGQSYQVSSDIDILKSIANNNGPSQFIVALGHAGWGPGQLEQEVMDNLWLTVPAEPDEVFMQPPEQRLNFVAEKMGINLNLMAPPGHA